MDNDTWEVIIIGGGSAGLSAALTLVRARRRVLVLDEGRPRNGVSRSMHAVLGHDGISPLELLAKGRQEIQRHGGFIEPASVTGTRAVDGGFAVATAEGTVGTARRLIVATGLRDELPDVPGLAERWGRGLAVCPYCDGYEVRDRRIGILATGPSSPAQAQLLRQWSADIIYLANGLGVQGEEHRPGLEARGIAVEEAPVARVLARDSRLAGVELADGRVLELDAIFTAPRGIPRDEPLQQLGAGRIEHPWGSFVSVDPSGRTSVPGLWAVGNVVDAHANVAMSIGEGAFCGGTVNHDLVLEDARLALAARATAAGAAS